MAETKENKKAKKANKKNELAKLDLVMSGLKTAKEKTLAKYLSAQLKKNNEKDSELKKLSSNLKQAEKKIATLEKTNKKSRATVYKEQKLRTGAISDQQRIKAAMSKIQKAVSARLKLLGVDFDNITSIGEALDASLKAINSLVAQLQEKDEIIAKLEKDIASLKKTIDAQKDKISYLEKKLAQNKKVIDELKEKLKGKDDIIDALKKENDELKERNKALEEQLQSVTDQFDKFKAETQSKFDEMAKTILDEKEKAVEKDAMIEELLQRIKELEEENTKQKGIIADQTQTINDQKKEIETKDERIKELLEEIERLKQRIKELEDIVNKQNETISQQSDRIKELEELLSKRNKEIEELKRTKKEEIETRDLELDALRKENERLKKEIARLDALVNYPRDSKLIQTEISGAIDLQLNDYPRLLKEIVALKQLLEKKNKRIADLEEENRLLMEDLQYLLKKSVAFYSDRSLHTGQVWNLECAPNRYVVATGATDMTVRLWRINPDADKAKGQKTTQVFKCARIDGKIDSLAWNKEGTLLAAGTGYRDGAEGFVCVWSMEQGANQYMVRNAIRSRPTLRFGRCYALCFSSDGSFVYCGDTVGSIWCINLESERIVGLFECHSDIVYDVCIDPSNTSLYSVSLDQTIAVIVIPDECGGTKGSRDSYRHSIQNSQDDIKDDYVVKDIKRKSGTKKKKEKKGKKRKEDKHLRNRSQQNVASEKKQYSSMTLKELLDQEHDDEFKTYDGIQIYKDERYNFWRICVSSDGKRMVTASRKIKIFNITGKDSISEGPNVQDMDNDHVKSLNIRGAYLLTARMGCPRAKLFSIKDAKEFKTIKCKKSIAQSDFLCDDSYCVVLQQELIPNQAPKAPSMKLYQYNKEKKVKVHLEPETPKKKDGDASPRLDTPDDTK